MYRYFEVEFLLRVSRNHTMSADAPTSTTEIFLAKAAPTDVQVTADCFGVREVEVPPLAENSLLLRTRFIGLEPYSTCALWSGNAPRWAGLPHVSVLWIY